MTNKHEALLQWVKQFTEDENTILTFESIDMYPNMRAVVPNYGDYIVRQDIVGNKYKRYTFAFVGVQNFSTITDDTNIENLSVFDKFNEWVVKQQKDKNFPDFGDNVSEYELSPLQNMANLAILSEDGTLAKYMLMVRIDYKESEEE